MTWRSLYAQWIQFGKAVNRTVSFILFAASYFLIVPFFYFLSLSINCFRNNPQHPGPSNWKKKRLEPYDADFFQRMG